MLNFTTCCSGWPSPSMPGVAAQRERAGRIIA
jgi:hypothetical protein